MRKSQIAQHFQVKDFIRFYVQHEPRSMKCIWLRYWTAEKLSSRRVLKLVVTTTLIMMRWWLQSFINYISKYQDNKRSAWIILSSFPIYINVFLSFLSHIAIVRRKKLSKSLIKWKFGVLSIISRLLWLWMYLSRK